MAENNPANNTAADSPAGPANTQINPTTPNNNLTNNTDFPTVKDTRRSKRAIIEKLLKKRDH